MLSARCSPVCKPLLLKPFLRLQSTLQPSFSAASAHSHSHSQLPINVKALHFPPQKLPVTHGHLKLDIQLRSYDTNNLEFFTDFVQRAAFYLGIPMTGPKPLPNRHETWTVIKSPFVHAKSKENFERFTHKRLLRCYDTNDQVIQLLLAHISKYSIAGVGVKCNLFKNEPINMSTWADTNTINTYNYSDTVQNNENENENDTLVNSKILELLNSKEFN